MGDKLNFEIVGVKTNIIGMHALNEINKKNKEKFIDYIKSTLAPEWVTTNGAAAVAELERFVNTRFQEYITYLDEKIDDLENIVVPALQKIDEA